MSGGVGVDRPYDLSLSLGVEFGSAAHEEAIGKIRDAAHRHGKKVAIYCQFLLFTFFGFKY